MPNTTIPDEILIITGDSETDDDLGFRGPEWFDRLTGRTQPVKIESLQSQVNIFLEQLNVVLAETPNAVGSFKLSEIEVSAGLAITGESEVKLALLAGAKVGGELSTSLRFVFKRE